MRSCVHFCNAQRILPAILFVATSSLGFGQNVPSSSTTGAAPVAAAQNPNQIAILRWYRANEAATFAVGPGAGQVAFDGTNIWVANTGDSTLTKLRASDGSTVGTLTAGVGPVALAFDGTNMWVANQGSNNVTKIRASDGTTVGTFAVGSLPQSVVFD